MENLFIGSVPRGNEGRHFALGQSLLRPCRDVICKTVRVSPFGITQRPEV
jgi:hypothetical protein